MRRLAESPREEPMVMIRRQASFASPIGEAERLIEMRGEEISRTAETPEQLIVDDGAKAVRRGVDQRMRHRKQFTEPISIVLSQTGLVVR